MEVEPRRRARRSTLGFRAPPQAIRAAFIWYAGLLGSVLLAFLVIPLLALALTQSGASLAEVARMADVRDAIVLSLEGAFLSAAAGRDCRRAARLCARAHGVSRQGRHRRAGRSAARRAAHGRRHCAPHGVRPARRAGRAVAGADRSQILGHHRGYGRRHAVRFRALYGQRGTHRLRGGRPTAREDRAHARARSVADLFAHHAAAGAAQHHDRRHAHLRTLDQRVRRRRYPGLLPDDGAGEDLRVVPALRARAIRRAAVLLLIVSLALFVLLRTLAQRGGARQENR